MQNISIIAINDNCEEKETKLKEFFKNKFENIPKYDFMDFKTNKLDDIITETIEKADQTILVFDAVEGFNPSFSYVARKLLRNDIKPILLISDSDNKNADLKTADYALSEIWSNECPWLDEDSLYFNNLYYSYTNKAVDIVPEVEANDDISVLIEKLDEKEFI